MLYTKQNLSFPSTQTTKTLTRTHITHTLGSEESGWLSFAIVSKQLGSESIYSTDLTITILSV